MKKIPIHEQNFNGVNYEQFFEKRETFFDIMNKFKILNLKKIPKMKT
jgi:hypothetical protein